MWKGVKTNGTDYETCQSLVKSSVTSHVVTWWASTLDFSEKKAGVAQRALAASE